MLPAEMAWEIFGNVAETAGVGGGLACILIDFQRIFSRHPSSQTPSFKQVLIGIGCILLASVFIVYCAQFISPSLDPTCWSDDRMVFAVLLFVATPACVCIVDHIICPGYDHRLLATGLIALLAGLTIPALVHWL